MELDPPLTGPGSGKIPVTVLTGFLGAGKTTLIRYILSSPDHGYRIAVVQNEFSSEMGIEAPTFPQQPTDQQAGTATGTDGNSDTMTTAAQSFPSGPKTATLIDGSSGEAFNDLWELPNGCICCSAKDDFIAAIDALVASQENSTTGKKFDYIIVESTGVADPEALLQTFWVDEGLDSSIYLDGVVAVVDTPRILGQLEEIKEARKQLYCGDVVLCNKMDLVTVDPVQTVGEPQSQPEEKQSKASESIVARLREMNPDATFYETVKSVLDLKHILNLNKP